MSEIEIIAKILNGEKEVFRLLVEKHQQMVVRAAMGFVHNQEEAEDIAQEVFINAYQHLHTFKSQSAFSTWMYRITVNMALNFIRQKSKRGIFDKIDKLFGGEKNNDLPFSDAQNPERLLISSEREQRIRAAIENLNENQRTAFVLCRIDELSQREVAEIMNISEGAVESLLQRAKQNLIKKLAADYKNSF